MQISLGFKIQDIPQGSQYHAVVHQCVLYHGNLNIIKIRFITIVLKIIQLHKTQITTKIV